MERRNRRPVGCFCGALSLVSVAIVPSLAVAVPRVPTHVACVGDSITYGSGASNQATKSYPADLQGLFGSGVQVKNFGHSGATMLSAPYGDNPYKDLSEYTAATNFVSGAGANAVVDVIIMLGTNDSKNFNWAPSGKPKNDQQYLSDYRAMVEHFSALPSKPLLFLALPLATGNSPCCSIDGKVIRDEIVPLIKQLAAEKHLPTIDLQTPTTGHPEYFGDGVHPTDAGYVLVAKLMHDGLLIEQGSSGGSAGGGGNGGGNAGSGNAGGAGNGGGNAGSGNAGGGSAGGGKAGSGNAGSGNAGSGNAGSGNTGTGGSAGDGASAGSSVGNGGTGIGGSAGSTGNSIGMGGLLNLAGAGVSAAAAGGRTSGVSSAQPGSEGCAISTGNRGSGSLFALGGLGLAWLVARRRRARG